MNTFIDYIYGTLTGPGKTMALLAVRRPVGMGIAVFMLVNVFSSLTALLGEEWQGLNGDLNLAPAMPAIFMISFLVTFLLWFVGLGVYHLLAELFGGEGSIKSLIATQGFAQLPAILVVPFAFLSIFLGDWLAILATFCFGIWTLCLSVIGVRCSYGLSVGRSIMVVILPILITIAVFIALAILVFAALWPVISQSMEGLL